MFEEHSLFSYFDLTNLTPSDLRLEIEENTFRGKIEINLTLCQVNKP